MGFILTNVVIHLFQSELPLITFSNILRTSWNMNEDGISDSMFCDKQEEMRSKEIGYFQEEISNNTIIQIAFK